MKLTWFGKTTLRVHIGGKMLVCDPAELARVDPDELVSGADRVFGFDDALPDLASGWSPRRPPSLVAEGELDGDVLVHRIAPGLILIDAVGEPPLVLARSTAPAGGRWTHDAVVVAFDEGAARSALRLSVRVIALAMPESAVDAVFDELRDQLAGTALVALEPGMALEV